MKQKLFILILIFFAQNIFAQTAKNKIALKTAPTTKAAVVKSKPTTFAKIDTAKNTDPSLRGQYLFMLSRSKSSYGAKLINPTRLDALWKSVNDTLRKERLELKNDRAKIVEQQQTILKLQEELTGKEASLNDSNVKLNEINFLGIPFTKSTYQLTVWSLIVVLIIALVIVIARSTKSIMEAKYRTQLYDEVAEEYQAYKTKANEQQRKLARELQDERNIIEELRSKGR